MPDKYHWHVLEQFIKENNFKQGVEIGVRWGQTSRHLLETCTDLKMTGVDLMQPLPNNTREGQETYSHWPWADYREAVKRIMQRFPDRFVMLVMDTHAASQMFADESVDFVFIDCDHSYEGVSRDIVDWAPKVRVGGLVTGHDINLESVRRAVVENLGEYETEGQRWNNIWWVLRTISNFTFEGKS